MAPKTRARQLGSGLNCRNRFAGSHPVWQFLGPGCKAPERVNAADPFPARK